MLRMSTVSFNSRSINCVSFRFHWPERFIATRNYSLSRQQPSHVVFSQEEQEFAYSLATVPDAKQRGASGLKTQVDQEDAARCVAMLKRLLTPSEVAGKVVLPISYPPLCFLLRGILEYSSWWVPQEIIKTPKFAVQQVYSDKELCYSKTNGSPNESEPTRVEGSLLMQYHAISEKKMREEAKVEAGDTQQPQHKPLLLDFNPGNRPGERVPFDQRVSSLLSSLTLSNLISPSIKKLAGLHPEEDKLPPSHLANLHAHEFLTLLSPGEKQVKDPTSGQVTKKALEASSLSNAGRLVLCSAIDTVLSFKDPFLEALGNPRESPIQIETLSCQRAIERLEQAKYPGITFVYDWSSTSFMTPLSISVDGTENLKGAFGITTAEETRET